MKISGRAVARFCARPDGDVRAALLYGPDAVEIADARRRLAASLSSGDDVRRLSGAEVSRSPALLRDALRERSFFGGRPVVTLEEAGDGATRAVEAALVDLGPEDGFLVVCAGALPARSKLRKLFEGAPHVVAAACYGDPPDREAITAVLSELGAAPATEEAMRDIAALADDLDRGAFADFLDRLSLYVGGEDRIEPVDVAACAPLAAESDLEDLVSAVTEGRVREIGPLMARLGAQGQTPVGAVLAAARAFRRLHMLAAAGGDVQAAIGRLRPPVFGPRRAALVRQSRLWPAGAAERALRLLLDADRDLRGGSSAAAHAIAERAFLRLSMTAARQSASR